MSAGVRTVTVKAIGWKEHNTLYIRGKEFERILDQVKQQFHLGEEPGT